MGHGGYRKPRGPKSGARGLKTRALFLCDMTVTGNWSPGQPGIDHAVVIGAGAAGLATASELSRSGVRVTVLERDREFVGGNSRTIEFMGCRFDLGPTPLESALAKSDAWLAALGANELQTVAGISRILHSGRFFPPSPGLSDLLINLGPVEAARSLLSLARARVRPAARTDSVGAWGSTQLGARLFSHFYRGYIEKVWGQPAAELSADGVDWLKPIHQVPVRFHYPRLGVGQLWQAAAAGLENAGHRVRLGHEVLALRHSGGRVIAVTVRDQSGRSVEVVGSQFFSSVPLKDLIARLSPAAPPMVRRAASGLAYRDLVSVNLVLDRAEVFPDQWLDVFDPGVRVARISNFKNFSDAMVADPGLTGLKLEYFCDQSDSLWSSADADLLDLGRRELVTLGICRPEEAKAGIVHRQPAALPAYPGANEEAEELIYEWLERALPNLRSYTGRVSLRSSSTVEQRAVNATVPGSNPGSGATDSEAVRTIPLLAPAASPVRY